LVELLVAMAAGAIILSGIYSIYQNHQRSYMTQDSVAAMQQNLRASLFTMEREIRLAGCDPTGRAGAGIKTAETHEIRVTMDITGGESDGIDNDGDGVVDESDETTFGDGDTNDPNEDVTYSLYQSGGIQKLGRKSTSTGHNKPVAEHIEALSFRYLDGNSPPNELDDDGEGNVTTSLSKIRSVRITILARTAKSSPGVSRQRSLSALVKCRNLYF
jgi:type IV pilus assembly protein PilW